MNAAITNNVDRWEVSILKLQRNRNPYKFLVIVDRRQSRKWAYFSGMSRCKYSYLRLVPSRFIFIACGQRWNSAIRSHSTVKVKNIYQSVLHSLIIFISERDTGHKKKMPCCWP